MKINQRLFDHYGIDTTKDLEIRKRCPRPFDTVLIDKKGSCYACECQSWLPQSIGNLQVTDLRQIIEHSKARKGLQESIEKGTYRYCNDRQCSWLLGRDFKHFRDDVPSVIVRNIRLAIDDSCNLRCPSCRDGMVFHKQGSAYDLGIKLANKVNTWLSEQTHDILVHIGSDGDPFASHVYRHFMEGSPRRDNITYSLLTNGLMYKESIDRVPHIAHNLSRIGVSIDGASAETYEKLRLGGRWHKILESLEAITADKRRHGFGLDWHMVVQNDNWKEMSAMAEMATKHNVDRLFLNKIEDWNTALDHGLQDFMSHKGYKEELARAMEYPAVRSWTLS